MLFEFSVSNFRSFREEATLSMVATKLRSQNLKLDEEATFEALGASLLRCAVIYGANGSGKSNLFKAMRFMKDFVEDSSDSTNANEEIDVEPFRLLEGADSEPSRFRILFGVEQAIFEYGFEVTSVAVTQEWLVRKKADARRSTELFSRVGQEIKVNPAFKEGQGLRTKTRRNALFLSVCAQFNGKTSSSVMSWFRKLRVISGLNDSAFLRATIRALNDREKAVRVKSLVSAFDLGFKSLEVEKVDVDVEEVLKDPPPEYAVLAAELNKLAKKQSPAESFSVETAHAVFDAEGKISGSTRFDLKANESEGTKKLIALAGPLYESLAGKYILVIDEFDARLHSLITRQIVKLFNSRHSNSGGAQLVAATHDTHLLDKELLRRDQVWFVEKDDFGASHLNSLAEYRVRNDASYEKEYVLGKYGAIPFLGAIERVFNEMPSLERVEESDK